MTKCEPDYNDGAIVALCEDTPTRTDTVVPVTEPFSNIHYKNRYCAYCSGVEETTPLITWKVVLYSRHYFSLKTENMLSHVRQTRGNMFFIPPDYLNVHYCEPNYTIDACNVTGQWPFHRYDRFIENACERFTNPYNYTYKNIFCFFCNHDIDAMSARPFSCTEIESPSMKAFEYSTALPKQTFDTEENQYPLRCSSTQFEDRQLVRTNSLCYQKPMKLLFIYFWCYSYRCHYSYGGNTTTHRQITDRITTR